MNGVAVKLLLKINEKLKEVAPTNGKLLSIERYFLLDTGENKTLFHLINGMLETVDYREQIPDIYIFTTEDELEKILAKEVNPLESYSKGRIKIKSSFMDKLLFSELLT